MTVMRRGVWSMANAIVATGGDHQEQYKLAHPAIIDGMVCDV